jgi:hypothetical protein
MNTYKPNYSINLKLPYLPSSPTMSAKLPLLFAAILTLTLAYMLKRLRSKAHPPHPPGPPAEPFIGHLRMFPTEDREIFFHDLGKVYGA